MNQSIFLNNVVDLVNEIATFLHNFLLFLTPDPSKQLTICVFAGLTRNPTAPPDHLKLLHQSAQQKGTFFDIIIHSLSDAGIGWAWNKEDNNT